MTILPSTIDVHAPNSPATRRQCTAWSRISAATSRRRCRAAARRRGRATSRAENCWCASASICCSIPASPFLELSPLAAYALYGGDAHAASLVTGIGRVSGRECMIVANDATVKGGTYYPHDGEEASARPGHRARESSPLRLPCRFRRRVPAACRMRFSRTSDHFGRIFYNQARMSAAGIPQIAIVMGSCTAGGAYVPAMCGREHHRAQSGHDLPRRAAAGEGGDRRGGERRGAGRRRGA